MLLETSLVIGHFHVWVWVLSSWHDGVGVDRTSEWHMRIKYHSYDAVSAAKIMQHKIWRALTLFLLEALRKTFC
jgi:hypothetical protein